MDIQTLADVFRSVILTLIFANFVFTAVILGVYVGRARQNKATHTNLTKHVVAILVGFLLLCGYCFAEIATRFGVGFSWRIPYLMVTFSICLLSEYFMFLYQMKRFRAKE